MLRMLRLYLGLVEIGLTQKLYEIFKPQSGPILVRHAILKIIWGDFWWGVQKDVFLTQFYFIINFRFQNS